MLNYLRIAVTALSLTACVLLVALWVRSYWRHDAFALQAYALDVGAFSLAGGTTLVVNVEFGRIVPTKMVWESVDVDDYLISPDISKRFVVKQSPHGLAFMLPHWFWTVLAVGLAIIPWARMRFSLRTLLIATTLVAVGLGMVIYLAG